MSWFPGSGYVVEKLFREHYAPIQLASTSGTFRDLKNRTVFFDDISQTDTYPTIDVKEDRVSVEHEASVSKVSDEQLFYLQSRGLSEQSARALIVNGFIDAFVQLLPMEYAVEINRLIAMEMEDSIG